MRREDWAYLRDPVNALMDEAELPTRERADETCARVGATTGSWMIDPAKCEVAFGKSSHFGITELHVAPAPNGGWSVRANVREHLQRRRD